MKQFKIFLLLVIALVLLIPSSGCAAVAGPWRGRVIDSETKAPIEGAVVVAVWYRSEFSVGGPVEHFNDARETMTDKDGKFEIPEYEYNPIFRDKTRPEFYIFKPGYGAFPNDRISPKEGAGYNLFINEGTVVELPKLKSEKERLNIIRSIGYLTTEPRSKVPKFMKLFNMERKNLGIGELH